MINLGFIGPKFTWSNKQPNSSHKMKRLNHAVVFVSVTTRFLNAMVEHYQLIGPILLFVGGRSVHQRKVFCFEDTWSNMEGFQGAVMEGW